MRVLNHILLSVCLLGASSIPVLAQKQKDLRPVSKQHAPAIYLLADGERDSVVLRWAPSTDVLWHMGNKYGYTVERFTAVRGGKLLPEGNQHPKLLTAQPIRPWSKAAMTKLVDEDEYAGVVEEAMYEEDFNLQMKGESPSQIVQQVQQSRNRFGFALLVCDFSAKVAKAAALRFVDSKPVAGEKYIYRVKIALPDSLKAKIKYQPGVAMRGPEEIFLRPAIHGVKADFNDRAVTLTWNQEMLHGVYTAYNIERSVDGGPFIKVNPQPFLQMTTSGADEKYAHYVDSLQANYVPCAYRIVGITPFGDRGAFSDTVKGEGVVKLEFRPFLDTLFLAANGSSAVLRWTLSDSIRGKISGIYISRAPKNLGPYVDINKDPFPVSQTEAIDPLVVNTSNYYKIRLVGKDGRQVSSLPYYLMKPDSIPPAIPSGLAGVSDKKGVAKIHWKADTEKDLKGYRLFRSQVKDGEFFEITKGFITDTAFMDTLNLSFTNPYVYYKVIALDHLYNSSDYSAPLAVRRPDTVAPMKVVVTGLSRRDTTVSLSFLSSAEDDLKDFVLYRINKETGRRDKIKVLSYDGKKEWLYVDTPAAVNLGATLIYEIDAEDSAGNVGVARSGELFYETGFRHPVAGLKAAADQRHKKIRLDWKYDQAGVVKYTIFRAVNDGKFISYANTPGSLFRFEDTGLHISNTYKYKIKAVMKNGVESMMTKEVSIVY